MSDETSVLEQPDTISIANRLAMMGLAMVVLLSSFNISVVSVALPVLAQTYSVPMSDVQWLVVIYLVAMTCLMPIAGFLGDRFGRKPLLLSGLSIFIVATIGCTLTENLNLLILSRFIQGSGAALLVSLAMTFVSDLIPSSKMGFAMGVLGTMSAVGTALGPVLGGFLVTYFHWHTLFYVSFPFCILSFLILANQLPATTPVVKKLMNKGVLLIQLQGNNVLLRSCITNFLVSAVIMSTMVVGPFYLMDGVGLAPEQIGLIMSVGPIVAAITGTPAGKLTDSWGTSVVIRLGLSVMLSGCFLIALNSLWALNSIWATFGYAIPFMLITAGYATFQAANNTAVMKKAKEGGKGVTSALLNFSRNLGLMTGASVIGWLYLVAMSLAQAGQDKSVIAFAVTFFISASLVALALAGNIRARS